MATCPRCREFLDDNHICRGAGGRALRLVLVLGATVLTGFVAGALTFGLLGDALHIGELETVGMVAGPTAALILVRAFRGF